MPAITAANPAQMASTTRCRQPCPLVADACVAESLRPRPTQPEKATVLCADEKSSVQALDRTQASLPMIPGRAQAMTHDYKRHGTTTLFAAVDVLTGAVIGQCLPRHRHQEFVKFLRAAR
jgi:hypothetical protein